jgi:pimeloyl-ACP methyl ester carboxylesterase
MPYITTSDGIKLDYDKVGSSGPCVVFIHGWGASKESFILNTQQIAANGCTVYSYSQRFHGNSDKPNHGYRVHRLAADLKNFIETLALEKPIVIGTSLGCAVIWAYVQLYSDKMLGKCIFVDQAPSQWAAIEDYKYPSKGIYDAKSLAIVQTELKEDLESFADGMAACCLSQPPPANILALLKAETLKCNAIQLGKLMADHAPADWRPVLPLITIPVLNLYGTTSGCFPAEGCALVGSLVCNGRSVPFEGYNHWLYLEDPTTFNTLVSEFVLEVNSL